MKYVLITGVVAAIIVVSSLVGGKSEYTRPEPEVIEKTVEVETLEKRIKEAQSAKEADIKTEAQKAYDDAYAQAMLKVELEVTKQYNAEIDAKQLQLEKQTKEY